MINAGWELEAKTLAKRCGSLDEDIVAIEGSSDNFTLLRPRVDLSVMLR